MTKESLEKAVLRLKAGEREAFDYIYDNTYKVVFFVVHNIVRQRETAEDIVQDTYITALRNIDSYSSNNLLAWLTTIAKRFALNSYNRGKRERITDFQEEGEWLCRGDMPDDDTIGLIKTAEKVLNAEDFQIVIMCAVAGYKRREVAKMMDMPTSTVTHRYTTSLQKLKRIIDGDDYEKN